MVWCGFVPFLELMLDHIVEDRHEDGGGDAHHQDAVEGFQRPQQAILLGHHQVAIAQPGKVDCRMVEGGGIVGELGKQMEDSSMSLNLEIELKDSLMLQSPPGAARSLPRK